MDNYLETQGENITKIKSSLTTFKSIDEIANILHGRFSQFEFHNLKDIPHPKELHNNMDASLLVCQSILKNEKIIIVGDYDADGICATCIMLDFFESLAYPYIDFAMPNRFIHGYGFSKLLFQEIVTNHPDVKLIVTVDNGVSSFEAGELCRKYGVKLIITDHHTLEIDEMGSINIPKCDFLVNPQQQSCNFPYKDICGSLVAWYFCCAIKINMQNICNNSHNAFQYLKQLQKNNTCDYNKVKAITNIYMDNLSSLRMESFLLLVGIAVISDVMPLNAINHTICKYAIKHFSSSKRFAFQILIEHLKCNIDSQSLGFRLIPLLNAAGRIDDGKIALKFLRSKSIMEAKKYFKQLKDLNSKRKHLQDDVTHKAFQAVAEMQQNPNMIFAVGNGWHEGVLGIVAGKMTDEFQKPCFVLTNNNGICKGSGRSYGDVDLIASMQKIGYLMKRYGGHVGAVGLEIEYKNIESFIKYFEPILYENEKPENILGILQTHLITKELFCCIEHFEPYGNGNPPPKFFIELNIIECRRTGQGFLEFKLQCLDNQSIKAMFFNPKYANYKFNIGDTLQFRATIGLDSQSSYNMNPNIMLIIDKIYGLQRN